MLAYYVVEMPRSSGSLGHQIPVAGGVDVTFHEPLGVVGVIVPWNFPMPIAGWGFAPALAAGNTVVLKPAELTPLTAMRIGELALEAGLPEDVFQILTGKGSVVGERFVTHPDVAKVVFTGSTEVGIRVAEGCARQVKPVTLELGGKSANVIFADADLAKAAASAPYGVFDNAGQDCCARSRILVQRSVLDEFLALLEPAVLGVRVEDPSLDTSEMGPLISRGHHASVSAYITDSTNVVIRGTVPDGPGFWYPPTVVVPDSHDDPLMQEETFGPIVAVMPFDDEADAIRLANDSPYGLSGSIFTNDLGRALRVSRGIDSGNLRGQLALVRPLLDPLRRLDESGARSRPHAGPAAALDASRGEVENVFIEQRTARPVVVALGFPAMGIAIVTGGARGSGIGLATARLAAEGATTSSSPT